MRRRTGFGALLHVLAILAFIVAGAQFTHAHELSGHSDAGHAAHIHVATDGQEIPDLDAKGGVHCGAHLLPLAADIKLAPVGAVRQYAILPLHHEWKRGPDFDTPPPRA